MSNLRISAMIATVLIPCMCFGYSWRETPPMETEIAEVESAYIARVTSHRDILGADGFIDSTRYEMAVIERLKGANQKHISVSCPNDSGRFPMEDGHTYLLFATRNTADGTYHIDATGNSQELKDGKLKPRSLTRR